MAVLDPTTDEIVIRVVYDGPPEAGKTTSLRALAGSLAQTTVTPEEDACGRTLWFDWMEYVGGRFEGSKIRCQIISVPGQRTLDRRRKRLLEGADVVVSVCDSTPEAFSTSLEYVRELRDQLARQPSPPVGVVLQANKRDVPGAVDLEEVRRGLGDWSVGVVESVAADGRGIREAFVYAVRLALDRVRDYMTRGALDVRTPELGSAADLLAALRAEEQSEPETIPPSQHPVIETGESSVAAALLSEILDHERAAEQTFVTPELGKAPQPPDASVPSGAIWPPVEGRAILYEVSQLGLSTVAIPSGDWGAGLGCGWRVVSKGNACFGSLDEGRSALIHWARLHVTNQQVITPQRCIVLADSGDGAWRLWQIVRVEPSLRDGIMQALDEETPELVLLRICQAARSMLEVSARAATAACALTCTFDTLSTANGVARYAGLMPERPTNELRSDTAELLNAQLAAMVAHARLSGKRDAIKKVVDRIPRPLPASDSIMATLISLFE